MSLTPSRSAVSGECNCAYKDAIALPIPLSESVVVKTVTGHAMSVMSGPKSIRTPSVYANRSPCGSVGIIVAKSLATSRSVKGMPDIVIGVCRVGR